MKENLLGLDKKSLEAFFLGLGEKPYRAQQVLKWIHHNGLQDFNLMTNLSKELRQKLDAAAEITLPQVIYEKAATDGTCKWLLRLNDGSIETVFIPENARYVVYFFASRLHSQL